MAMTNIRPLLFALTLSLVGAAGCGAPDVEPDELGAELQSDKPLPARADADGDGSPFWKDCDDTDASVHPGAKEICDGRDNDCDGFVDTDSPDAVSYYPDQDRDGFGGSGVVISCVKPTGYVVRGGDCDDTRSDVFPSAPATCDGADTNCDGSNADEISYCLSIDEPVDDPSAFDPGNGDGVNDPSDFDPGDGDPVADPSDFDPGAGDPVSDPSDYDPSAP